LPWILSVYAGQVDMNDAGVCVGYKAKAGMKNQTEQTGCCFLEGVTKNAWLMFLTSLSYFVIQIPAFMVDDQKTKAQLGPDYLAEVIKESKGENFAALCGCFFTLFMFSFYLYLQYLAALKKEPPISCLKALLPPPPPPVSMELVKKQGLLPLIDHYRENFLKTGHLRVSASEVAMPYADEASNAQSLMYKIPADLSAALKSLFVEYAAKTPSSGLHGDDMRQLLSVVGLAYTPDVFAVMFKEADADKGGFLDQGEFLCFFYSMITGKDQLPYQAKARQAEPAAADAGGDDDEEEDEMPEEFKDMSPAEQRKSIIQASLKQMCIGTFLVLIFSDPMVDVLAQIGVATGVPAFYVSFVLAPLASNASELVASYKLASRKTSGAITQSLQTLEGAACMNNTFCLGIFFFLIYYQGLAWKFTAETLSIFLVQFLVFLIVIRKSTQTKQEGILIFMMYPVSLVFVAALEGIVGLD